MYNVPTRGNVLTFGILGLALSQFGIPGLILSIIGRNKARAYAAAYGQVAGIAKAGSILAKVGLILSIVMCVFWTIYLIAIIAGVAYELF